MTIYVPFAKLLLRLGVIGSPAFFRSRRSAAIYGPVTTVETPPNCDGAALLQARQELMAEAQKLRNLRRNKAASLIEAELRAVTLRILGGR